MGSVTPAADVKIAMADGKFAAPLAAEVAGEAVPRAVAANATALCMEAGDDGGKRQIRAGACVGRLRMVDISLRSAVVAFLVVSLSAMLTSTQHSSVQVLGFSIPVSMKWSRSQPFEFLVVVEALICGYALLQFIYQSVVLVKNTAPTRRRMWLQLGADQASAYLILAAAAAAAGASRMNKAGLQSLGVQNIHVPSVCMVLDKFCNRATIAIVFTLLAACASAICAALDAYMLMMAC